MSRAHTFRRTRSAIVTGRSGPTRQPLASGRASASIMGESDERLSGAQIGHETADFLCSQQDIGSVIHLLWTGNLKVSPYRCESDFRVSLPLGLAIGTGRIGRTAGPHGSLTWSRSRFVTIVTTCNNIRYKHRKPQWRAHCSLDWQLTGCKKL